ncbi:Gfo/Idh/MocA family protein [Benzoatithermus flavus]|uniref:Gfo/Idh/MocA family oxidoreductase n=1 Tax=Benzoatithermus flavus TaxID=3108223 RepID=A0ABU8XMX6_9PROT
MTNARGLRHDDNRSAASRICGTGGVGPRTGIRVGVVGCGYWGSKHVRVLSSLSEVREVIAVEPDPEAAKAVLVAFPAVRVFADLEAALPHVDALVIATPAQTHAKLALTAIRYGLHVLVEKPLATSLEASRLVVEEARRAGIVLMVGHTFQFNPAIREMRRRFDSGELGDIYYIHSARLNLGLYRPDVNVVWDLAPHDLSIMNFLLRSAPKAVTAWGASLAYPHVEDLAFIRVEYNDPKVTGFIHLSWLDPRKTRTVTLVGSRKMVVYDDLAEERVRIYDRGLETGGSGPTHERPISYRYGDVVSPYIQASEPLALQDRRFVECIRDGRNPESNGIDALAIIAILEAIDRSLHARRTIEVEYPLSLASWQPDMPGSIVQDAVL